MAEDPGSEAGRRTDKHLDFHESQRRPALRRRKLIRPGRAGNSCHAKAALRRLVDGKIGTPGIGHSPLHFPAANSPPNFPNAGLRASIPHLPGFRTTHHPGRLTGTLAVSYYGQSATRSSTMFNISRLRGVAGPLIP